MKKLFANVSVLFALALIFCSCRKQNSDVQNAPLQNQAENQEKFVFEPNSKLDIAEETAAENQLPENIGIFDYALDLPGTFAAENDAKMTSWFSYYFLGWSKDGKICYVQESYSDGSGLHLAKLRVQDLISDKIVFESVILKNETDDSSKAMKNAVGENWQEIKAALEKFGIVLQKAEVLKMPIKYEDFLIQAEVQETPGKREQGLVDFSVFAVRSDGRKKRVTSNDEPDFPHEKVAYSADVQFYLQSPYESRAAILVHTVCRGFECSVDEYRFAGCLLSGGFE